MALGGGVTPASMLGCPKPGCSPRAQCLVCQESGRYQQHHCAKFSAPILSDAVVILDDVLDIEYTDSLVLDPFAGTGKGVEYLRVHGYDAWGVELEPEWAVQHACVIQGNALHLPFRDGSFDAVFTSPTYANRMADKDLRESVAGTYAKSLGRLASVDSSCHLQWGPTYRKFHEDAWAEAARVIRRGGYFLLNCKDHYRNKELQPVTSWHCQALAEVGFNFVKSAAVPCPGNRRGQNGQSRVDHENLVLLRKG